MIETEELTSLEQKGWAALRRGQEEAFYEVMPAGERAAAAGTKKACGLVESEASPGSGPAWLS